MKKLFLILSFLFCFVLSYGQSIVNRSNNTITVSDSRLQAGLNFFVPRYADTTAANTSKGIDSCGALIFTYDVNGYWFRSCSPKVWTRVGTSSVNIYNVDGRLTADRLLSGFETYALNLDSLTALNTSSIGSTILRTYDPSGVSTTFGASATSLVVEARNNNNAHRSYLEILEDSIRIASDQTFPTVSSLTSFRLLARSPTGGLGDYTGALGTDNTNLGSGFRWLVPSSQGIKTVINAYGFLWDSATSNSLAGRLDSATVFPQIRATVPSSAGMAIGGAITNGTTPSVLFVGTNNLLSQRRNSFVYDSTNQRLGLSTDGLNYFDVTHGPQSVLYMISTSTGQPRDITGDKYNNAVNAFSFLGRHARGTPSSPLHTNADDALISFAADGHTGVDWTGLATGHTAVMSFKAARDYLPGGKWPSYMTFETTDTNNLLLERVRINEFGQMGIGITTALASFPQADIYTNDGIFSNAMFASRSSITNSTVNYWQPNFVNNASTTGLNNGILYIGNGSVIAGHHLAYNATTTRNRLMAFATTGVDFSFAKLTGGAPTAQSAFTDIVIINTTANAMGVNVAVPDSAITTTAIRINNGAAFTGAVWTANDATGAGTWKAAGSASAAGSTNDIQLNSGGAFGVQTGFTYNGTLFNVNGNGTGRISMGNPGIGNFSGLTMNSASLSSSNYSLLGDGTNLYIGTNGTINFRIANSPTWTIYGDSTLSFGTNHSATVKLWVSVLGSTQIPEIVSGSLTQTANLTEWRSGPTTAVAFVTASGGLVLNENSNTAGDFRWESDANANGIFADASAESIGIFNASPSGAFIHIGAGTTASAPLKLTTGTSLTSALAGSVEFTTDDLFFTITTGTARKRLLMADPTGGLTSGRVPFATTNGRLTDDAGLVYASGTLGVGAFLNLGGTTTPGAAGFFNLSSATQYGILNSAVITPGAGVSAYIYNSGGTINEAGSGTHTLLAGMGLFAPTINTGGATVTNTATLYIDGPPTATVSGGNYSLYIAAGNLSMPTAGSKLFIGTGSNASVGSSTLVSGTVTISTTAVTSSSLIFVVYNTPSGTLASGLSAPTGSIVNGTSFVVNSLTTAGIVNTLDNSTVRWWIIN